MTITVELPDDVISHADPSREALEALAIAGYRSRSLSQHQAATLLHLGRFQFEQFLKDRGIVEHAYSADDLLQDIQTMERLRAERLLAD